MKLSILIAAYNVELYIEKCITSCYIEKLAAQYEIIVINDGSTDQTRQIIENLGLISNLKIINKENEGLGSARNSGLEHASGQFIWFIDGDDYIEEDILQPILKEIEFSTIDVLALNYSIVDAKGNVLTSRANVVKMNKPVLTGSEFYKENYAKSYSCFFVFRVSLFNDNNVFFKERINMQDSEIFPRLMLYVTRISFLDEVSYYYVQHPNSFTNSNDGKKRFNYFNSIIEINKSLNDFLRNEVKDDLDLREGLIHKIEGLHKIVLSHMLYFTYKEDWLIKIIELLKKNNFYPLTASVTGKLKIAKWGLNNYPIITKKLVDNIQDLKNKMTT